MYAYLPRQPRAGACDACQPRASMMLAPLRGAMCVAEPMWLQIVPAPRAKLTKPICPLRFRTHGHTLRNKGDMKSAIHSAGTEMVAYSW